MGGFAQGLQSGLQRAGEDRARKNQRQDMLTDEQHALKRDEYLDLRQNYRAQYNALKDDKGNIKPEYQDQAKNLMDSMSTNEYNIGQLYDPIKAPGRLQQDWHYLREKIHGLVTPKGKASPSPTTQSTEMTATLPAASLTTPELPAYDQTTATLAPAATGSGPSSDPRAQAAWQASVGANAPRINTTKTSEQGVPSTVVPAMEQDVALTRPVGPTVTGAKEVAPSWGQAQVLKHKAAAMQKAQQEAALLAVGAGLSPEQQANVDARTESAKQESQIVGAVALAKKLGIELSPEEIKQKMGFKSFALKPIPGAAGQPMQQADGSYARPMYTSDNTTVWEPMPPGWKPNVKSVPGTLINTKQHGWIKTWIDPFTQKVTGWQPFTPGRTLTGSTSSSTSTDQFGLTTSTSRSTMPTNTAPVEFDFSGVSELSSEFNGEETSGKPAATGQTSPSYPSGSPNKSKTPLVSPPPSVARPTTGVVPHVAPKSSSTPTQLKSQVPAPPVASTSTPKGTLSLDSTGHIPNDAPYNKNLIGAANQLLDGMDITKLTIPQKAKEAASNLARAYGWGGQGMFTPREALQLKEGASFLNLMANSPSLKVLDNGFFANIPMTGTSNDPAKEGFFGKLFTNLSARNQTPDQQKFMDLYRQLDAMAIGLRALVQTGRGTQKQTDLLISELPNPYNTPSSEDARRRLGLVQKELDIAAKTGKLPEFEDMQKDFNAQGSMKLDEFMKKYNLPKQ